MCVHHTLSLSLSLHRSLQSFNSYHIIYKYPNYTIILHVDFDIIFWISFDITSRHTHTHTCCCTRESHYASCLNRPAASIWTATLKVGLLLLVATWLWVLDGVGCFSLYLYQLNGSLMLLSWNKHRSQAVKLALWKRWTMGNWNDMASWTVPFFTPSWRVWIWLSDYKSPFRDLLPDILGICFDALDTKLLAFTRFDMTQSQGWATASSWKSWTKLRQLNQVMAARHLPVIPWWSARWI